MLPMSDAQRRTRYNAAKKLHACGDLVAARNAYADLMPSAPNMPELPFQLARIAEAEGDLPQAATLFSKAETLKPAEPLILAEVIRTQAALGHKDAALAAHDRLIALTPKAIKPRADKAWYLQRLGQFDAAEKIYRKLLREHPDNGELYRVFLGTKTLARGDPMLREMARVWALPKLPDPQRMHLGFAMAKGLNDAGQTEQVFKVLNRANAIQRAHFPYDAADHKAEVDAMLHAQARVPAPLSGGGDPRPVFVTGLPRSGTTLVERIVARHSDVVAGGEMAHALRLAYARWDGPAGMPALDTILEADLRGFAGDYLSAARNTAGPGAVVTDKSIQPWLILGLLRRALPGARFVLVHRDPRDIALSIYRNYFSDGTHRYSNHLPDIARYVHQFRRMVAHWRAVMPGVLHEVHYEDLVANPEPVSRALIDAAGLDWQDACLSPHEGGGNVRTLSLHQVRQPIYRTSAAAWEKHGDALRPFTDELARLEQEDG